MVKERNGKLDQSRSCSFAAMGFYLADPLSFRIFICSFPLAHVMNTKMFESVGPALQAEKLEEGAE